MRRDELFRQTVAKLAEIRDGDVDELTLLETSGRLRKLLLDGDPLVHQVNRQRRKRIRYIATDPNDAWSKTILSIGDGPMIWFMGAGISPRLASRPSARPISLTHDQFLALRAARIQGTDIPVKAVILQLANIEGGVHAGTPKTDMERQLAAVNEAFTVGEIGAITATIYGITEVVVHALEPLT